MNSLPKIVLFIGLLITGIVGCGPSEGEGDLNAGSTSASTETAEKGATTDKPAAKPAETTGDSREAKPNEPVVKNETPKPDENVSVEKKSENAPIAKSPENKDGQIDPSTGEQLPPAPSGGSENSVSSSTGN